MALPPTLPGRLSYDPPMPPHRDSLTQQIPAGTAIKYQIGYPQPMDGAIRSGRQAADEVAEKLRPDE